MAQGSYPAAKVSLYIGNKEHKSGKINAVSKPVQVEGTETITYETTLSTAIIIEWTLNNKAIQCKASITGLDKSEEKRSSSITITFSGCE